MNSKSFNITNANIISLDQNCLHPKSLIIKNGIIDSVNRHNSKFETIDLKGATVIPGFIDSHFHLRNLGKRLDMINLRKVDSLKKVLFKSNLPGVAVTPMYVPLLRSLLGFVSISCSTS